MKGTTSRLKAVGILVLLGVALFFPLISISSDALTTGGALPATDDQHVVTEGDIGFFAAIQYGPGSTLTVYTPTLITDDGWVKGYFFSNTEPKKVHYDFYNPTMRKIYSIERAPSFKQEGSFSLGGTTYRWMYADETEFTVPAFPKSGIWVVRSYFKGPNGERFSYGPIIEDNQPLMLGFPVVSGTIWDNLLRAPIYVMGFKTVPLIWWMSPLWLFGIFFVALIAFTRSVGGAVEVLKSARKATRDAREKWKA